LESFLVRLGDTSFASAELDLVQRALDALHTMRDSIDAGRMPAPEAELARALGGTAAVPQAAATAPRELEQPVETDATGRYELPKDDDFVATSGAQMSDMESTVPGVLRVAAAAEQPA